MAKDPELDSRKARYMNTWIASKFSNTASWMEYFSRLHTSNFSGSFSVDLPLNSEINVHSDYWWVVKLGSENEGPTLSPGLGSTKTFSIQGRVPGYISIACLNVHLSSLGKIKSVDFEWFALFGPYTQEADKEFFMNLISDAGAKVHEQPRSFLNLLLKKADPTPKQWFRFHLNETGKIIRVQDVSSEYPDAIGS